MAGEGKVTLVLCRPARLRQLRPDGTVGGDYLDVPGGTEVAGVPQRDGRYLVEHQGFHAYLDSFNLNLVDNSSVCQCLSGQRQLVWCPKHGTIYQRRAGWMKQP
jgi:hypothetical protein